MYWVVDGVEAVERRTFECPEIAQHCEVLDD
jgi:hypothetical protein